MKTASLISRYLLGVMFLIFGLNGFFNFIPAPPPPANTAGQFQAALAASNYMIPVSALEILASLCFLTNRYVPIGLVLLGPILVNILLFHILMAPETLAPGIVATILFLIVFASRKSAFAGIFVARVDDPQAG